MKKSLSRRDFLKISGLALASLAFTPDFPHWEDQAYGELARVAIKEIDLYAAPRDGAAIIGKRYRDAIVHIYAEERPADAPEFYNPLWYRVWGGFIHSAHLQRVKINFNPTVAEAPESGMLAEVTVPYTTAYQRSDKLGWYPWRGSRLYYGTTHWITGVEEGPDGEPWYLITSELSKMEKYYAPAQHLRLITAEEIAPLSPNVPAEKKRVRVSINRQTLWAYENDEEVYSARISSGIPNNRLPEGSLPTATPEGEFRIYSKMPTKHMGSVTGNPDALEETGGFSLPGVPWTLFFRSPGGYAFHGTYWHNNFGLQMSHGCVNMRNEDAKWLFRWTTPVFESKIESPEDWEKTGYGTVVEIAKDW